MNKSEALEWLIENVTKWPTSRGGIKTSPDGWSWGKSPSDDAWLFRDIPTVLYTDCHIAQQEWLDGALTAQRGAVTVKPSGVDVNDFVQRDVGSDFSREEVFTFEQLEKYVTDEKSDTKHSMPVVPNDWQNPLWGLNEDWRLYANSLREIWHTFNDEQKQLISLAFKLTSDGESNE